MRRNFTKLLSLIMTLCMLVGIMPMWLFVSAAETTESKLLDTAVFASDVHAVADDLQNVMSAIGADDIEPSSVNLLGDTMLKMSVAENAIETGLGVDTDVNYVYASKHDDPDTDSDAGDCDIAPTWDFSGPAPNDADYNYHIYIIRESDIAEGSRTYSSAISAFTTWANNITDDKPIFVITHRPLHVRRGENDYAGKWFDAINPVGEDKDVFVLWGHNHYGETSADRNAYYVAKGSTLDVQYTSTHTSKTTNFTYMNAGYINANDYTGGNQYVGRRYMATVAFIYNDKIVFQDYFYNKSNTGFLFSEYYYNTTVTSGKYLDYGVKNLSNASYAHNETVELMNKAEIGEPEVTLTKGGIAVTAKGMTTLDVAAVDNVAALNDTTKYIGYLAYDMTFDMEEGATATVVMPVPADYKGNLKVFYVDENGELEDMNAEIADGYATFKTTHNSVYALANERAIVGTPTLSATSGHVYQFSTAGVVVKDADGKDINILVTYEGEAEPVKIPLTVGMITGAATSVIGDKSGLTVTYNSQTITQTFTLTVMQRTLSQYPEYPDPGAIKVNKTATGHNFQDIGIAEVELSASGVPVKKGADLIIMLDTSSSMTKNQVTGSNKKRSEVLEESLADLIKFLKAPGDDGETLDVRVAIADFNGYYGDGSGGKSGTPYDRTSGDYVKNGNNNGSGYSQASEAQVYTGSKALNSGAFIHVNELDDSYTLNYTSGTNYDYAFDAIYQLGTAAKNSATEERDLYVIFMSDGASLQWNYFGTQNTYTKWNNWLAGTWGADDLTTTNLNRTTHSYFYDLVDHDGDGQLNEHRMANAIKGDPNKSYEIIRKSTAGLPEGTLTAVEGKQYLYNVPGLGAKMFTINFDAKKDGSITVDNIEKALKSTASDTTALDPTQYYYKVTTASELKDAFDVIGAEISYAATKARFVDKMGPNFNLQIGSIIKTIDTNGADIELDISTSPYNITPKIVIKTYDIWTRQNYIDGLCSEIMIGTRKSNVPTVIETVTFNADGTEAYSDQIEGGKKNILAPKEAKETDGWVDGVIYAKSFIFNTNKVAVAVDGVEIPNEDGTTTTKVLPAETFYWKIGTIQTKEVAMSYFVYLEGALEGGREAASYATNEYAVLYYDNYLGNPCMKETVSPQMAWKSASVKYAFYLVDENGRIITNQTTGETGSFVNKIAITQPVVYKEILLNNEQEVNISVLSNAVIPEGYVPYDGESTYTVVIPTTATGSWTITHGDGKVESTYVTDYLGSEFTNKSEIDESYDYTNTTVWFALVWTRTAHNDSVVVDFGLPVDIHVLGNDMFGELGNLYAVGPNVATINQMDVKDIPTSFGSSYKTDNGTATMLENGLVRYQFDSMNVSTSETFKYAVNYTGTSNAGLYFSTVTVIPAANVYYEESFVKYTDSTAAANGIGTWTQVDDHGTVMGDKDYIDPNTNSKTQTEDRPGFGGLPTYDANKIYGYDPAYDNFTQYSLGSAKKVTVNAATGSASTAPIATFDFTGTGFDLISVTNSDAGLISARIFTYDEKGIYDGTNFVKGLSVDNYYGYDYYEYYKKEYTYSEETQAWTYVITELDSKSELTSGTAPEEPKDNDKYVVYGEGEWVVAVDQNADTIWQVPVLKFSDLTYGKYHVEIKVMYGKTFDHIADGSYSFWLDAIRIYDPVDTDKDTVAKDAYIKDNELDPAYKTLRDLLVNADDLGTDNDETTDVKEGVVFIDGKASTGLITDYANPGPNNETYLLGGQGVSFKLKANVKPKSVHLGIKLAIGNEATLMYNNTHSYTVKTATDMYYDLGSRLTWKEVDGGYESNVITLSNATEGAVISITNVKYTSLAEMVPVLDNNGDKTYDENGKLIEEMVITPVIFTAFIDEEVVTEAPAMMFRMYRPVETPVEPEIPEVPDPFVPETFETSWIAGKAGKISVLTVTTSDDVASVTIDGNELAYVSLPIIKYENRKLSVTYVKVWMYTVKLGEGTHSYELVAYDADGLASEPVEATVTVVKNGRR